MTSSKALALSSSKALAAKVAEKAAVTVQEVEQLFATHSFPLAIVASRPRKVRLLALRIWGYRRAEASEGEFDVTFNFSDKMTIITGDNLGGKSSILEVVAWCLRGKPRNLQEDVRRWLRGISLNVCIGSEYVGVRIELDREGAFISGRMLSAESPNSLPLQTDSTETFGRVVVGETDEASFEAAVETFMMSRLDLESVVNAKNETGTQTHGWPAYYSVLHIEGSGQLDALLGDHIMGALSGRLLQIFLDIRGFAVLTRIKTKLTNIKATKKARDADEQAQSLKTNEKRADLQRRIAEAKQELELMLIFSPEEQQDPAVLSDMIVDLEEQVHQAKQSLRLCTRNRRQDEGDLADAKESRYAKALFHGLDPKCCPRCESRVTPDRRSAEREEGRCAVCATSIAPSLEAEDPTDDEAVAELQSRYEASCRAEARAKATVTALDEELEGLRQRDMKARAARESLSSSNKRQRELELTIARLEGAIEALQPDARPLDELALRQKEIAILSAASKILDEDADLACAALFGKLNKEIVKLAKSFGFVNLEEVAINRQAQLEVTKGGGAKSPYGRQSRGEKFRLKIAVLISLLRVGREFEVSTHPGLLMIDTARPEEMTDLNVRALVAELKVLCETEGVQMVVTTADRNLAREAAPGKLIPTDGNGPTW